MQRHAERLRLLLVGHRRLDRLHPAGDHDPVALLQQLVERLLLEIGRGEARDQRLRTCSVSIAIDSRSASRRRWRRRSAPTARRGENGRGGRRPGRSRSPSVVLPGSIPRRRMSSVKEVIVSSWAIFGSLTKVPEPRRRIRYPSRTRSSRAARTVRRETPRSALSWRSDGIASPTPSARSGRRPGHASRSASSRSATARRRSSRAGASEPSLGSAGRPAASARAASPDRRSGSAPGRPRAHAAADAGRVRGSTRAVKSVPLGGEESRLVLGHRPLRATARRIDVEERVRVGAELLDARSTSTVERRQPGGARTPRPRSASGRIPSTTPASRRGGRCAGSSGSGSRRTRPRRPRRRLDEVHRGRADEGGHEQVARARGRAAAARPPAARGRRACTATRWPSVIASVWSWVT